MIATLRERLKRLDRDSESGQAMVEFVLVFPIQLLLTIGIIQFAFIAHAYLVVGQAAFMGARAAAVADMQPGVTPQAAARRQVARTVALLTTGNAGTTTGSVPTNGGLQWQNTAGNYGFNDDRAKEAYGLLAVPGGGASPSVSIEGQGEYIACEVTFNYIVLVPIVVPINTGTPVGGRPTFRIRRVGYVPTPWKKAPVN